VCILTTAPSPSKREEEQTAVPVVIRRLKEDATSSLLLVCPLLSSRPWLAELLSMASALPVFFPIHSQNLVPPEGWFLANVLPPQTLTFVALTLSGSSTGPGVWNLDSQKEFSVGDGKMRIRSNTTDGLHDGEISLPAKEIISSISEVARSRTFLPPSECQMVHPQ